MSRMSYSFIWFFYFSIIWVGLVSDQFWKIGLVPPTPILLLSHSTNALKTVFQPLAWSRCHLAAVRNHATAPAYGQRRTLWDKGCRSDAFTNRFTGSYSQWTEEHSNGNSVYIAAEHLEFVSESRASKLAVTDRNRRALIWTEKFLSSRYIVSAWVLTVSGKPYLVIFHYSQLPYFRTLFANTVISYLKTAITSWNFSSM